MRAYEDFKHSYNSSTIRLIRNCVMIYILIQAFKMSNYIQHIPKELQSDIVAQIAASSLTDYFNVKLRYIEVEFIPFHV